MEFFLENPTIVWPSRRTIDPIHTNIIKRRCFGYQSNKTNDLKRMKKSGIDSLPINMRLLKLKKTCKLYFDFLFLDRCDVNSLGLAARVLLRHMWRSKSSLQQQEGQGPLGSAVKQKTAYNNSYNSFIRFQF